MKHVNKLNNEQHKKEYAKVAVEAQAEDERLKMGNRSSNSRLNNEQHEKESAKVRVEAKTDYNLLSNSSENINLMLMKNRANELLNILHNSPNSGMKTFSDEFIIKFKQIMNQYSKYITHDKKEYQELYIFQIKNIIKKEIIIFAINSSKKNIFVIDVDADKSFNYNLNKFKSILNNNITIEITDSKILFIKKNSGFYLTLTAL
jgi:hypothetical protein